MKVLLEINGDKVIHLLKILKGLSYVNTIELEEKVILKQEITNAVQELKRIREGKLEGIPIEELLNEL